jgi:hypothetical protein
MTLLIFAMQGSTTSLLSGGSGPNFSRNSICTTFDPSFEHKRFPMEYDTSSLPMLGILSNANLKSKLDELEWIFSDLNPSK